MKTAMARTIAWLVIVHFAVSLLHGAAHIALNVPATFADNLFRVVVIGMLPFLAWELMALDRYRTWGAWLLTIVMVSSWLYGAINHFVLHGDDHIQLSTGNVWWSIFTITAVLLFLLEAWGMLLGIWLLWGDSSRKRRSVA